MSAEEHWYRRALPSAVRILFLLFAVGNVLSTTLIELPRRYKYPMLHSVCEEMDERFFRDLPTNISGLTVMSTTAQRLTIKSTLPLEYLGVYNARTLGTLAIDANERLTYLELDDCALTSWDPSLANLTALESLRLSCRLSGTFDLAVLSGFPKLTVLQLDWNQIDRIVYTRWPNRTVEYALTALRLQDNNLTHLDGSVFEPFVNLQQLILSNNQVQRQHLAAVPVRLPKMERLDLDHNRLTEVDFRGWECPVLQTVMLHSNQLTSFPRFGTASELRMLKLSFNKLTTIDERQLGALRNLRLLNLDGNNIHHWPAASVDTELPYLLGLHLSINPLETVNFTGWHLPQLQALSVSSDTLRTISEDLFERCPLLDEVRAYCIRLDCGWIERHMAYIERRVLKVAQIGTYKMPTDYNCTNRPVCYGCARYMSDS